MTMVLYEASRIKRFIQLTIEKFIAKKMERLHKVFHNVLTDEDTGGN